MSKNYKLSLNLPQELGAAQQRVLEGTEIVVTRGEGYVGPLTDEELKLAKKDPYITVHGEKDGKDAEGGDDTPETPENPETPLDRLMKKKRPQLNKIAQKAGVEKPEELKDKQAVAEAILAAEKATEEPETPETEAPESPEAPADGEGETEGNAKSDPETPATDGKDAEGGDDTAK
jgi:hypothetical protein